MLVALDWRPVNKNGIIANYFVLPGPLEFGRNDNGIKINNLKKITLASH